MSICIMSTIWDKNIPTEEKMILLILADSAHDDGTFSLSLSNLSKKASIKTEALCKYLLKLKEKQWIIKDEGEDINGDEFYAINIEEIEQLPDFQL